MLRHDSLVSLGPGAFSSARACGPPRALMFPMLPALSGKRPRPYRRVDWRWEVGVLEGSPIFSKILKTNQGTLSPHTKLTIINTKDHTPRQGWDSINIEVNNHHHRKKKEEQRTLRSATTSTQETTKVGTSWFLPDTQRW